MLRASSERAASGSFEGQREARPGSDEPPDETSPADDRGVLLGDGAGGFGAHSNFLGRLEPYSVTIGTSIGTRIPTLSAPMVCSLFLNQSK